jgi:hypothetical protein
LHALEVAPLAGAAHQVLLGLRCCQQHLKALLLLLLLYYCCDPALHLLQGQPQLLLQLQAPQSSARWPGCYTAGAAQRCCPASKVAVQHPSAIARPQASHCMLAAAALDLQELLS